MDDIQKVRLALDAAIRVLDDRKGNCTPAEVEQLKAENEQLKRERDAAIADMRLIKQRDDPAYADGWNSAIKIIKAASTVGAVPVVRCKDCIWFGGKHGCPLTESGYFLHGKMLPLDNDYCSYGERRVENGGTTSD